MRDRIVEMLEESSRLKDKMARDSVGKIETIVNLIVAAYEKGKKVVLFGNGGSAADAQHIAGELTGRFKLERRGLRAMALTADTSVLTSIANDYGFENVFARQVEAQTDEGDVVIAISTSGRSLNVLKAVKAARLKGARIIAFTGKFGNRLEESADVAIKVPSANPPRIQEACITVCHIICELVESELFGG